MKVTLTFNLPEEADEHKHALRGLDLYCAAFEFAEELRRLRKYGHGYETPDALLERLQVLWNESFGDLVP